MPSSPEIPGSVTPRRATILGAYLEGWRRVLRAPAMTAGIWAATLLTALLPALLLKWQIEDQLGSSLASERIVSGWDATWASDFAAGAQGLGKTLTHEILGFGGAIASV